MISDALPLRQVRFPTPERTDAGTQEPPLIEITPRPEASDRSVGAPAHPGRISQGTLSIKAAIAGLMPTGRGLVWSPSRCWQPRSWPALPSLAFDDKSPTRRMRTPPRRARRRRPSGTSPHRCHRD